MAGSSVVACYELCEILEQSAEVLVPRRTLWEADCTPASSLGLHALRKILEGLDVEFCFIFSPLPRLSSLSMTIPGLHRYVVLPVSTVVWLVIKKENT